MSVETITQADFRRQYGDGCAPLADAPLIGSVQGVPCVATPEADVRVLGALVESMGVWRVLEIGCCAGATSAALLRAYSSLIEDYVGLDLPRPQYGAEPAGHFALGDPRFTLAALSSGSREFDPTRRRFDLVFVDGAHDWANIQFDTTLALAVLAPRGTIAWHDYGHPGDADVVRYIDWLSTYMTIRHVEGTWTCWARPDDNERGTQA